MSLGTKYKLYGVLVSIITATSVQSASVTSLDPKSLTSIEIIGNQKQTKDTILLESGIKEGDSFDNIDLTRVLNNLWLTNLYDDIKLEAIFDKEDKKIIFRLKERPTIKEIKYIGGKGIGINTIKEKIKDSGLDISIDSIYSLELIRKIKNLIIDLALTKGFINTNINVIVKPIGPTSAQLIFDIQEGSKIKIKAITIQGNKNISTSSIKAIINNTRKKWPWSDNLLIQKNIDGDIENIKQLCWKSGYKDVSVGQSVVDTMDNEQNQRNIRPNHLRHKQNTKLTISIIEGERFSKGVFKVEGDDKDINKEKIEKLYQNETRKDQKNNQSRFKRLLALKQTTKNLLPKKSQPLDLHAANHAIDEVVANYHDQGYMTCQAQKKLEIINNLDNKMIDIAVNINKGKQFEVRHINFEGNIKTKDKILRRSMIIDEGDAFNLTKLRDSFVRLSQLGYFKIKQDPKLEQVANTSKVDVTITGEESGTNTLMLKGGLGSNQGFSVGGSLSTDNLSGNGQSLGISFDTSSSNRILSIDYTEPFFRDTPYSITTSIFSELINPRAYKIGVTDAGKQINHGIGISGQTKLSTFLPAYSWAYFTSGSIGYQFRVAKIEDSNSCYFRSNNQSQLKSSLSQSITYSTINHPFRPTSGESVRVKFEYGGWQFREDSPFFKTAVDYKKIVSINNHSSLYLYADCGYIKINKKTSKYSDTTNLYRPGGENSIRGFAEQTVGPTTIDCNGKRIFIGGNKQLVINLEYQIRLVDTVQFIIFHDLGQAWTRDLSVNKQGPRLSAGVELRLFLPISPAPIRLIWARKLNQYPFDKGSRHVFQFSIGTNF
jgi:outer membrane protein insertion porin family